MSVFESPFLHQFIVAGLVGVLFGQISVALIHVPRWLIAMLSD